MTDTPKARTAEEWYDKGVALIAGTPAVRRMLGIDLIKQAIAQGRLEGVETERARVIEYYKQNSKCTCLSPPKVEGHWHDCPFLEWQEDVEEINRMIPAQVVAGMEKP